MATPITIEHKGDFCKIARGNNIAGTYDKRFRTLVVVQLNMHHNDSSVVLAANVKEAIKYIEKL